MPTEPSTPDKPAFPSHRRLTSETGDLTPRRRRRSSAASNHSRSSSVSSIAGDAPSPSHPANVFRNLLIMEEALRVEYTQLRFTRRKYTLFVVLLIASTLYFSYTIFVDPSIYRVIHFFNRLSLMISLVTLVLFYISGSYSKTLVHSRKFIHNANKGLLGFNVKLVKIPPTWTERFLDIFWKPAYSTRPGSVVKIVLSPKAFNPDTVDGWEIYRQEYWNREFERSKKKAIAQKEAGGDNPTPVARKHRRADSSTSARRPLATRASRASVDLGQGEVVPRPAPRKKALGKSPLEKVVAVSKTPSDLKAVDTKTAEQETKISEPKTPEPQTPELGPAESVTPPN